MDLILMVIRNNNVFLRKVLKMDILKCMDRKEKKIFRSKGALSGGVDSEAYKHI